ncbi:FadR/GntR family transcriptional regulator [Mahella australiensis]|uniref:Regulatory protein GntR HTH n=1 Tax=Mahella australiensis (strain DSM 15567 / CIP 107919 / 50-1 BON) TaxID=697281 RepID=F3ZZA3_MAHA5|nr:FadR/GntR family transcriptional regulator [Mahella australiensis]AEE97885.1 regulatory protein GntR HTH [Mahella australiensis 50-1 BON]
MQALTKPVKTGSVVKLILDRIKEALINKELKAGDYLPPEAELAKSLGVGKTSVREAIKMLEAMGVVEVRQGDGTFIKEKCDVNGINSLIFALLIEQGSNIEIFELREMFEPAYMLMAMKKATPEDIELIGDTIKLLEDNIRLGRQQAEDDLAFHYAILNSTHNPFVISIGSTVLELFKASIGTSMKRIPQTAVEDHKKIFKAFCDKNEMELFRAVMASFEGWKSSLEETK